MTKEKDITEVKVKRTEGQMKELQQLSRVVGYNIWKLGFRDGNPGATDEEVKLAWENARDTHSVFGKKVVLSLEKAGYVIQKL
jgi:hypothetical protein